jgi:hypothetical protein
MPAHLRKRVEKLALGLKSATLSPLDIVACRARFAHQGRSTEMSEMNAAALPPHGTSERWQAGCDCTECLSAMREKVWESDLDAPCFRTLRRMLDFRVRGCELYIVPAILSEHEGVCVSTARRGIDRLVEVAVVSKIADIEGQSGRSGIYLLHVEKLKIRSGLRLSRAAEGLQTDGVTKITSWRLMMLKEHETSSGEPCVKCGIFPVPESGFCAHCYAGRCDFGIPARCPVCQDMEIPKAFFDPKMRSELERVERARATFFQPRRLVLVKS